MAKTQKTLTVEHIQEEIKYWENELAKQTEEAETQAYEAEAEAEDDAVNEDEWLPADDLHEDDEIDETDISTPVGGYAPNTVGALIQVLKRTCGMNDLILPRLKKQELMVFDIYSKNGRAVIDFVEGRVDDPAVI